MARAVTDLCLKSCASPCITLSGHNLKRECGGCTTARCRPNTADFPNATLRIAYGTPTSGSGAEQPIRYDNVFGTIPIDGTYPHDNPMIDPTPTFRPACDWQRNDSAIAIFFKHFGELAQADEWETAVNTTHRMTVHTCNQPHLRGMIAGPFRVLPREWVSLGMKFDILGPDDPVISYTGDAVTAAGDPVEFPPLHLHHIHIRQLTAVHWFETHGDYELQPGVGYTRRLPDGYCSRHHGRQTLVEAQVNDVRTAGGSTGMASATQRAAPGSSAADTEKRLGPIEFYLRIVFELSTKECTPVSKLYIFNPRTKYAKGDQYERYAVGSKAAIMWWTVTMARGGSILPPMAWIHSHRPRYRGLVLISGNHTLNTLAGLGVRCGTAGYGGKACRDLDAARASLVERAGQQVICADDPSVPSYRELPASADGAYGGYYDRAGAFSCKPWHFRAGDVFTVFSLSSAVWNPHIHPFPQHTMIFLYYVPDDLKEDSIFVKVFPRQVGAWEVGSGRYIEHFALNDDELYIVPTSNGD